MAKQPIKLKNLIGKHVKLLSVYSDWSGAGTILAITEGFMSFKRDSDQEVYWFNCNNILGVKEVDDDES